MSLTLSPGTRLDPYEMASPLGAGGMDSPLLVKRNPFFEVVAAHSPRGVVEGLVAQHRDGDGEENAVQDTSQGSGVAVALGTKPVVVVFEVRVFEEIPPADGSGSLLHPTTLEAQVMPAIPPWKRPRGRRGQAMSSDSAAPGGVLYYWYENRYLGTRRDLQESGALGASASEVSKPALQRGGR